MGAGHKVGKFVCILPESYQVLVAMYFTKSDLHQPTLKFGQYTTNSVLNITCI